MLWKKKTLTYLAVTSTVALVGVAMTAWADHKPGHQPPGGGGGGGGGGGEPRYTLIDLGTLGTRGGWASALSVNNLGQVVGASGNLQGVDRAFLLIPEDTNGDGSPDIWFQDAGTGPNGDSINGLMIDLGTLATGSPDRSWGVAVNNHGQVTGRSSTDDLTTYGSVERGFVIIPDGDTWFRDVDPADGANDLMIDLGTLAYGDGYSYPYAISDSGYVAGYVPPSANSSAGRAFIVVPEDTDGDDIPDTWFRGPSPGGVNDLMIDLGTLGEQTWGGRDSRASAVNDNGWVAGDIAHDTRAFLIIPEDTDNDGTPDTWFRDADGNGGNDLMIMLPLPRRATRSSAQAINSVGQVVGQSWTSQSPPGEPGNFRAVRWDIDPDRHDVTVTDLGRIQGEKRIFATGMNNSVPPQVVGSAYSYPSVDFTPFLWENGEIYKLLDLISNGGGIEDLTAGGINDSGQIVGGGSLVYIAIPAP